MSSEKANAEDKAIEALIGASLRLPHKEEEISEEEIRRYVDQRVTLDPEHRAALEQSKPRLLKTLKAIVLGSPRPDEEHVIAKHSKGIFYRRAAFDTYVIHSLARDPNLGRTKIEKITHLTEYYCGVDFERTPVRDAAGPVDYTSRRKVESLGGKKGWYSFVEANDRRGVKYILGPNFTEALPIADRLLRARKPSVDALLQLMSPLDTRTCEVIATLYAAWNDLLLDGGSPDDADIVSEAREHWHPKKLTIPLPVWAGALQWMRERGIVPRGTGRRVRRMA